MRQVNRIEPQLGAHAYKTYSIAMPRSTHWRDASCSELDCPNYLNGWSTTVDETADLGQGQAHYIRKQSGRHFTEHKNEHGLTVFVFRPGQKCFRPHQLPLEKPPLYLVQGGDWRGNPAGIPTTRHVSGDDWVHDFAEHQQRIADQIQKG